MKFTYTLEKLCDYMTMLEPAYSDNLLADEDTTMLVLHTIETELGEVINKNRFRMVELGDQLDYAGLIDTEQDWADVKAKAIDAQPHVVKFLEHYRNCRGSFVEIEVSPGEFDYELNYNKHRTKLVSSHLFEQFTLLLFKEGVLGVLPNSNSVVSYYDVSPFPKNSKQVTCPYKEVTASLTWIVNNRIVRVSKHQIPIYSIKHAVERSLEQRFHIHSGSSAIAFLMRGFEIDTTGKINLSKASYKRAKGYDLNS